MQNAADVIAIEDNIVICPVCNVIVENIEEIYIP
jgi:hypothetical protein